MWVSAWGRLIILFTHTLPGYGYHEGAIVTTLAASYHANTQKAKTTFVYKVQLTQYPKYFHVSKALISVWLAGRGWISTPQRIVEILRFPIALSFLLRQMQTNRWTKCT